jgi:23S rRNA G2069 N7-methylase RlmK/C1962 C5-methylase RlmI
MITLTLKPGKEANVGFLHPWIFSGALEDLEAEHGSFVRVADKNGKILATGSFSARSSIAVRCFEFGEATIDRAWLEKKIGEAHERRALMGYGAKTDTNGYRVVFGESDGIPGLVIDRFADTIVFQISTAGMDALREDVIQAIVTTLQKKGYVASFKKGKKGRDLEVTLPSGEHTLHVSAVKRISRLSKRLYRKTRDIRPVRNGSGIAVISTPKGVLSDADARAANVGGEVLFEIW